MYQPGPLAPLAYQTSMTQRGRVLRDTRPMDQTKLPGDHGGREAAVAGIVLIALGVFAVALVGALVIIAAAGGATG